MSSPLSIAIVTPTLSRSGGGIFPIVRAHAKGLALLPDTKVTVYGLRDAHAAQDVESMLPLVPRAYDPSIPRFGYAPQLATDLMRGDQDIVHQHGLWQYPSIAVSRWRSSTGRPVIISTQGMLEPWALANSATKKRIAAMVFERSNLEKSACLQCSMAEVAGVRAYGLRNPIAVLPNGVDLPPAIPVPRDRPAWMKPDRKLLLFLGRIHPKKGIAELIRAWSMVKTRAPEVMRSWQLAIAGWDDGGHVAPVRELTATLGLNDDVSFPGPLFDMQKDAAFAHAQAFILPSYSEGLPMSVLEAWSHRLPVLMTRECNLVQGFDAGAAIEITTQPESLADTLARSLVRTDLSRIGEKGRALVETSFSWTSIVADLDAVYRWLAGRGERPPFVQVT